MPTPRSNNVLIALVAATLLACVGLLGCTSAADDGNAGAIADDAGNVQPASTAAGPSGPPATPVKGAGFTCEVKKLLTVKCQTCHTDPPAGGAVMPLMTVQDMLDWSKSDPTKTVAQLALERMRSTDKPMPPADFGNAATPDEIQAFEAWTQANFVGYCQGAVPPNATCTTCHGDAARTAGAGVDPQVSVAPPHGTNGETLTSQGAVGAHMAHLTQTDLSATPLKCNDCHVLPTAMDHANGVVDIAWGPFAKAGGANPDFNGATCTNVYCHGGFPGGRNVFAPSWTGGPMNCGSCHGTPPPTPPHTNPAAPCSNCHGAGYDATAQTVNKATHINGVIDVSYAAATCSTCHGDGARVGIAGSDPQITSAPPAGTHGETAATTRAVGAHMAHLNQTDWSANPIKCSECHPVPTSTAHSDGVVEVAFGPFAKSGGANPTWNGTTCANAYCHGGFAGGNTANAPSWETPGSVACGSCHALPPADGRAEHANKATECSTCHGAGYSQTAKTVNKATHINGVTDTTTLNLTCTSCHGDNTRAALAGADPELQSAPPKGTHAETLTSTLAVGAHVAHLNKGTFSNPIACNECHAVPISVNHSNGVVDMAFGTLAKTGGVTPAWNVGATTCTASYCHGNFKGGSTTAAPNWEVAGTLACNSCHALPPATPEHSNPALACSTCHGAGYDAVAQTVNKQTHINGIIEVNSASMTCSSCHGDSAGTRVAIAGADPQLKASPPLGTHGETLTSTLAVGMHQGHLDTGTFGAPTACAECHTVPISNSHSNGVVDMAFGALSKTGGVSPAWNAAGASCSSTYCHGNFSGGSAAAPTWTSGTVSCTSCHGNPPATPPHSNPALACSLCHGTGYSTTTVNLTTHMNGVVNVDQAGLTCTSCHGTAGRTGVAGSDPKQAAAPPVGTHGETATSSVVVGAHQAHLNQTTLRATPIACNTCHFVPTSNLHSDGVIQVTFGGLSLTGGATPTWNGTGCASTYCHGNFSDAFGSGTKTYVPSFTAGAETCTSCHGDAPNTGKHGTHNGETCGNCHGTGYTKTAPNLSLHINGVIDYAGPNLTSFNPVTGTCTATCHGNKGNW
ncbi:MAG TPA: CxxxxCH/CxxCH domain-containing protein [Labilithrix sp.]